MAKIVEMIRRHPILTVIAVMAAAAAAALGYLDESTFDWIMDALTAPAG